MRFDIITIFPHIFDSYFNESIIKRAKEKKMVDIRIHNLRDYSRDKHHKVDDKPYGGGAGMVMQVEPIVRAVEAIVKRQVTRDKGQVKIVLFSAKGKPFNQKMAYDWSKKKKNIIFITGRYEGIDERVITVLRVLGFTIQEVSIGPYITTDGDVAAMVVVSALTRLTPNVINWNSLEDESFLRKVLSREVRSGQLEYPHYTRPEVFVWPSAKRKGKGKEFRVPKVLLSGDHKKIKQWRGRHWK